MTNLNAKTLLMFARVSTLTLASIMALSACSVDDPDQGNLNLNRPISGAAIDGYIAGATVYVDFNNNSMRDVGEPKAITDKDGYFSSSKDGLIDYCASDASSAHKRHCLKANYQAGEVMLRLYGGYDLFTGEPFDGTLSTKAVALSGQAIESQMMTPMTTIVSQLNDTERDALLGEYGLVPGDMAQDFLTNAGYTQARVATALTFHKVATIFADAIESSYTEIGEHDDFPDNSFHLVYQAMAENIVGVGALDPMAANIANAFDAAESAIRALYTELALTPPAFSSLRADAILNAGKLIGVVESLLLNGSPSLADAESRALAIELVTRKIIDGASSTEIDATIVEASDISSDLFANLLDSGSELDFIGLAQTSFQAGPDFTSFAITNSQDLIGLPDQQMTIEYAGGGTITGKAIFYFDGESEMSAGTFSVCLAYQDSAKDSEEETTGSYFDGDWFSIDENRLVLTFGGGYDIAMVSKGLINEASINERQKYSMTYGGDTLEWISQVGLETDSQGEIEPVDDASCKALLDTLPSILLP